MILSETYKNLTDFQNEKLNIGKVFSFKRSLYPFSRNGISSNTDRY